MAFPWTMKFGGVQAKRMVRWKFYFGRPRPNKILCFPIFNVMLWRFVFFLTDIMHRTYERIYKIIT